METNTSKFLSTTSAANLLGMSTTAVQVLMDENKLMGWRTAGGHRRISMQSIHEYQVKTQNFQIAQNRLHLKPRILVAIESPKIMTRLKGKSASWRLPVELEFVNSLMDACILLGSDCPDVLIAELTAPQEQQSKTLAALNKFNSTSNPIPIILIAQESTASSAVPNTSELIQVVPGPLSEEWLRACLTGVVALAKCRRS